MLPYNTGELALSSFHVNRLTRLDRGIILIIMLTTLEANFVQEYKLNGGNATQAVIKAGYQAKYPAPLGSQLLKKSHIRKLVTEMDARLNATLTQPIVRNPYLPAQVLALPSKEEYASKAWLRSSDESKLKDETKFKYYDLTGRALRYVSNDEEKSDKNILNIICNDLNLTLTSPLPDFTSPLTITSPSITSPDVIPAITPPLAITPPSITSPSEGSAHE